MLDYVDFYDIAEYGNKHWKGSFTPKEIACNAYDYLVEFEASKASKARKTITSVIQELCKLLAEDGSEECKEWLYQIADELDERSKKMNYKLIIESGEYALILRGSQMKEYAVVNGLDKEKGVWAWTCVYYNFDSFSPLSQTEALANAIDYFRYKTEENYIPRCRLEELATLFKDGIISDDRESAMEYFNEVCEMTEEEKSFFGIEEDSPIANTKFENPMYNKGYDDGFSDGANSADIESEENMKNMIKNNECMDSDEYVALITGKFPDKEPTLKELEEMELDKWNYPLTEIDHIMENEIPVILVRFPSPDGGYDYRFCEVEAD